jgi:hypothetical protein
MSIAPAPRIGARQTSNRSYWDEKFGELFADQISRDIRNIVADYLEFACFDENPPLRRIRNVISFPRFIILRIHRVLSFKLKFKILDFDSFPDFTMVYSGRNGTEWVLESMPHFTIRGDKDYSDIQKLSDVDGGHNIICVDYGHGNYTVSVNGGVCIRAAHSPPDDKSYASIQITGDVSVELID